MEDRQDVGLRTGFPDVALGFPEDGESAVNSGIQQNAQAQVQGLLPLGGRWALLLELTQFCFLSPQEGRGSLCLLLVHLMPCSARCGRGRPKFCTLSVASADPDSWSG